ncbi:MAG: glutathione S-transferase family protein [Alphaproteobacteria bacterium]|nr:glutathione S-transferase family protein [Alphaproteobacteria bacterium]
MARYTLIVGTRNWSSWSLRPFLALSATGAPFDTVDIRLRKKDHPTSREQILEYSPAGKVPVLKIEESASSSEAVGHQKSGKTLTVWDSLAICETIAERHPEAGLWPADANARAIARSYSCEMHSGFPDLRDQLTMDFVRNKPMPELREDTQKQIARIIAAWEEALAAHKGDYLFGKFSVADCMYAPVVSRFDTYGVTVPASSRAYMDRIIALPGMEEWRKVSQGEVDAGLPSELPPVR